MKVEDLLEIIKKSIYLNKKDWIVLGDVKVYKLNSPGPKWIVQKKEEKKVYGSISFAMAAAYYMSQGLKGEELEELNIQETSEEFTVYDKLYQAFETFQEENSSWIKHISNEMGCSEGTAYLLDYFTTKEKFYPGAVQKILNGEIVDI